MTELLISQLSNFYDTLKDNPYRRELSRRAIYDLTGIIDSKKKTGNYLLEDEWLPWASDAAFVHSCDTVLNASAKGLQSYWLRESQTSTAWAIPSQIVLDHMAGNSSYITEIGSGRGYWVKLLRKIGCRVVAVDNGSELKQRPLIKDTKKMDGVKYVEKGYANGSALFFCYPRREDNNGGYVKAILSIFAGDTFYFVGELDDGSTFDIGKWLQESGSEK